MAQAKTSEAKIKYLQSRIQAEQERLEKVQTEKHQTEEQKRQLEADRQRLEKEKEELNRQLQAKLEAKNRIAVVPTAHAAPANYAAGSTVWDRLAQCESGGNWAINSGNGYYGGLQFDYGTWGGYGGFATANLASREVQIQKAEQIRATRGFSPWPSCARRLGLL